MRSVLTVIAAIALLLTLAGPTSAHHSFSAEFDANKQVNLTGEVVMMEWVNPHSWLHIDVKKPDGSVERWKIEGGSPSVLFRLGWNRGSSGPWFRPLAEIAADLEALGIRTETSSASAALYPGNGMIRGEKQGCR